MIADHVRRVHHGLLTQARYCGHMAEPNFDRLREIYGSIYEPVDEAGIAAVMSSMAVALQTSDTSAEA